jgi:NAD(P)H-dependent FMN reductase
MKIIIISGSARPNRQSHKIALEVLKRLDTVENIQPTILDVREKPLPLLESIYRNHPNPTENMHHWKKELDQADAFLIVSPEHNGSYSGALKNTLDHFFEEYNNKPMGIIAVSAGALGGINAAMALQHFCLKVGGLLMPAFLITPKVQSMFDADGILIDESYSKRLDKFLHQFIEFSQRMNK